MQPVSGEDGSFSSPVSDDGDDDVDDDQTSGTKIIDEHCVSGFACYRVTEHEQYQTEPTVYSGPDVMKKFYQHIMRESDEIGRIIKAGLDMTPLTSEEQSIYDAATVCGNCDKVFTSANWKVKHHCHVSGRFMFAACNNCNLQLKMSKRRKYHASDTDLGDNGDSEVDGDDAAESYKENYFLPVVFHNLKSYGAHFVIRHFQNKYTQHQNKNGKVSFDDINVIPLNGEKYMMFEVGKLRFLDSFQFLSTSLDELVSLLLKSGKDKFKHTTKYLGNDDIVFSKGVYCYSYMTGRDKFAETKLPPIEMFYNTLKDEKLDAEDYRRAQEIWTKFNIENMQRYHDHYLLSDVLLLADVVENFRNSVMEKHKLDCLHYFTLPSLAWNMALKHTKAKLDLITDSEIYLMLENSLRGGIATISKRYAVANNPHVDGYDETQPHTHLSYLDANSLYATAQSEPLPVGDFHFLSDTEIQNFDLMSIAPDAPVGYIIECDLAYPPELHDRHSDYPMAAEHLTISRDMLSPFASNLIDPKRPWKSSQKLVPNLFDKIQYVCHYRNLQLYVKHGLKVTKIRRILSFTQSPWLKPWIDQCNEQRREAKSDFESDLAKLQANATFGKTMEQVRHRVNIRLIADPTKCAKAVSKVSFRRCEIINPDLVMVHAARQKVKLNKPISVGFAILELSKYIMYSFYYEYLKPKYLERCTLLFTDTDSLCCEIKTDDLYADMGENLDLFDTSNFATDHPQYSCTNRRVLGKFKSETGSIAPKEFVGLRAKMYSLYVPSSPTKSHKKAKGVQKNYVKKRVRHEHFVDVLHRVKRHTMCKFRGFRSKNHVVRTLEMTKICLSAFDDKRYILDDGMHTLAYGHYSLRH